MIHGDSSPPGSSGFTRVSLKDSIARQIREQIFAAELRPNTRVPQDELAAHFRVSRLPVREALIQLAAEGLVVILPHQGAYIAPLLPQDIHDLYEIFGFVAGLAARQAATAGPEGIDALKDILRELDNAPTAADRDRLNVDFHRAVNRAGSSIRLRSAIKSLSETLPNKHWRLEGDWPEIARQQHWEIVDALEAADGQRAHRATMEHFASASDFAVNALTKSGFWAE